MSMRTGWMAAILCLLASTASGATLLEGEVASVDKTRGVFLLMPSGAGEAVVVQAPGRIPPFVQRGSRVRVEGSFGDGGAFRALSIQPSPSSRPDPTGVRSRLHRNPQGFPIRP
jgi:hypothetical protein